MKKKEIKPAQDRLDAIEKIKEYEKIGGDAFFNDVEQDPPSRTIMPDEVDYLNRKFSSKFKAFFALLIEKLAKRKIKKMYQMEFEGVENIKDLDSGAVITSNHFSMLENVAIKFVSEKFKGRHKYYRVIREGNYFFPGIVGFLLKNCRTLPLSSNTHTMLKLDKAIKEILEKKGHVLIYPEQSMWWYYPKPRNYRIGAFHYAAKNKAPVVPCFVTFSKTDKIAKNGFPYIKYTVHIMKPIFPDPDKTVHDNALMMQEENYRLCKEKYEEVYKIPLEYGNYDPEQIYR